MAPRGGGWGDGVCAADLGGDGDPGLPRRAQGHQRGLRDRQHSHAHHQRGELCPLCWGGFFQMGILSTPCFKISPVFHQLKLK